jgi:hypothetical protein
MMVPQMRTRLTQTLTRTLLAGLFVLLTGVAPALADSEERVKRIFDRLVGVPPSEADLAYLVTVYDGSGGPLAAALEALEHPVFYSSTLKNFATPWTNEDGNVYAPLNDFSATVIGMVRDDVDFSTVLSADLTYRAATGVVTNGYSQRNNNHYEQIESGYVDLSDTSLFVGVPQSSLPGSQLSTGDAAGVLTTRASAEAYLEAGTNRALWRFTAINFLCRDMEDLHDTSLSTDWIRQDVTRSPGGDSSLFLNGCMGCHNGMDPMAGAFAYLDWEEGDDTNADDNGRLINTPGNVRPKYTQNANTFPFGYVTTNNRWQNRWVEGRNSVLGWPSVPRDGYGAKSLGQAVGASDAFATCQVEKVFKQVCFRPDESSSDRAQISTMTQNFKDSGYKLKQVFAEVAEYCTRPDDI